MPSSRVMSILTQILRFSSLLLLRLCTITYRRPLIHYTIAPIQTIIQDRIDPTKLRLAAKKFRAGKQYEQKLVGIASTLSAGATIGIFSWPDTTHTPWYSRALWYSSLLLAIFSLIGSSQQRLLDATSCLEDDTQIANSQAPAVLEQRKEALRVFMSPADYDTNFGDANVMGWYTCNMMFVWQWTLMLMVWSWICFLVAFMLHVIRPFLPSQDLVDQDKNVAVWFLAVLLPILVTYGWCAWWVGYVTRKLDTTNVSVWKMLEKILG